MIFPVIRKTRAAMIGLSLLMCPLMLRPAPAEIIYLKDGSYVKGLITDEGKDEITIKDSGGEKKIRIEDIHRILYGNMDMEKVYILGTDGRVTRGFMVDQDSEKIIIRESRDLPEEKTIPRKDIREISRDSVYPPDLEIFTRPAFFLPIDSGNASLKSAPFYSFGLGFNAMFADNTRFLLESGYLKSGGSANGQYLSVIPVTLSLAYRYRLQALSLVPKIGCGLAVMEFNNGENDIFKSRAIELLAGAGLVYYFAGPRISLGLWCEYMIYYDRSDFMQAATLGLSCGYRI
jgi:hypothetical protein